MKKIALTLTLSAICYVVAAERVWTGAAGDGKAKSSENWQGDGNDIYFPSSASLIDLTGFQFNNMYINQGLVSLIGDINSCHSVVVAAQNDSSAALVKEGGDWNLNYHLKIPHDGSINNQGVFTNKAGNITAKLEVSVGKINNAGNTSGEFVIEGGDHIFKNNLKFGSGENVVGKALFILNQGSVSCNGQIGFEGRSGSTCDIIINGGTFVANGEIRLGGHNGSRCTIIKNGGILNAQKQGDLSFNLAYSDNGETYFYHNGGKMSVRSHLDVSNKGSGFFYLNDGSIDVGETVRFGAWFLDGPDKAEFHLNGGILSAKAFNYHNGDDNRLAHVFFNGGIFKATASCAMADSDYRYGQVRGKEYLHEVLKFNVAERGAVIDTGDFKVIAPVPFKTKEGISKDGGLWVKGAGSLELLGGVDYNGTTTIEVGAKVLVNSESARKIISNGLKILPPASITSIQAKAYEVLSLTSEGEFTQEDLDKITSGQDASEVIKIVFSKSEDGKTILATISADGFIWTGKAGDNKFSTAGNWLNEEKPQIGANLYLSSADKVKLVNDIGNLSSIVILGSSAPIDIDGDFKINSIYNKSTSTIVFNGIIEFENKIDITGSTVSHPIVFPGMVIGNMPPMEGCFAGNYDLSRCSEWNLEKEIYIARGTKVLAPNAALKCINYNARIHSEKESKLSVKSVDASIAGSSDEAYNTDEGYVLVAGPDFKGELQITEMINVETRKNTTFSRSKELHGVVRCSGISWRSKSPINNFKFEFNEIDGGALVIGKDGVTINGGYLFVEQPNHHSVFRSSADWSLKAYPEKDIHFHNNDVCKPYQVIENASLSFDTSDFDDRSIAHTITAGHICLGGVSPSIISTSYRGGGKVKILGCGRFILNTSANIAGGFDVLDTATLSVAPSVTPGGGVVSVASGATFEVAASGKVALSAGKGISLADGAALAFNFTDRLVVPSLELDMIQLGENKNIVVKISSNNIFPMEGKKELTTGGVFPSDTQIALAANAPQWVKEVAIEDGNIVLSIKSKAFRVIVR